MNEKGNQVATVRKKAGLTQEQLAELLSTSQTQIMRLETGKRQLTPKWMAKISEAINHHLGREFVKAWHLMVDADELENLVQSEEEIALLKRRRQLEDAEQKAFDQMTRSLAESLSKVRKPST